MIRPHMARQHFNQFPVVVLVQCKLKVLNKAEKFLAAAKDDESEFEK